ncbi:hypothetical protein O6H91_04G003100 [Diphasiastrum complanatum]|uniref:Uncharacterized protein n=1 Tax=Diphasiastrum complanatum TaxID=34168 RepID=A0ACC2DU18_DIPCM|nr:hypothetical protein O6H91_04G003100 [Diphasiastrum complanatum]
MASQMNVFPLVDCTTNNMSSDNSLIEITKCYNLMAEVDYQPVIPSSVCNLVMNLSLSSKLHKLFQLCGAPLKVSEIPTMYNGNVAFELPPSTINSMADMKHAFDGHGWLKFKTTTMQGFDGTMRLSDCAGGFVCNNPRCGFWDKKYVTFHWQTKILV